MCVCVPDRKADTMMVGVKYEITDSWYGFSAGRGFCMGFNRRSAAKRWGPAALKSPIDKLLRRPSLIMSMILDTEGYGLRR